VEKKYSERIYKEKEKTSRKLKSCPEKDNEYFITNILMVSWTLSIFNASCNDGYLKFPR
jgi:hypothetical protein